MQEHGVRIEKSATECHLHLVLAPCHLTMQPNKRYNGPSEWSAGRNSGKRPFQSETQIVSATSQSVSRANRGGETRLEGVARVNQRGERWLEGVA